MNESGPRLLCRSTSKNACNLPLRFGSRDIYRLRFFRFRGLFQNCSANSLCGEIGVFLHPHEKAIRDPLWPICTRSIVDNVEEESDVLASSKEGSGYPSLSFDPAAWNRGFR